jgi:hypothetical protein
MSARSVLGLLLAAALAVAAFIHLVAALYEAFDAALPSGWASLATGAVLLALALILAAVALPSRRRKAKTATAAPETVIVSLLANLVRDRPIGSLLTALIAGLVFENSLEKGARPDKDGTPPPP